MEETEQAQIPEVAAQAVDNHEKTPQESFAELRKAREHAEREEWKAKKELEMLKQMQQQQKQQVPDDDFDINELEKEAFPDGKQLVKAFGKIDKKISAYEQKLVEKDIQIQALQFSVNHPDFKDVVTADNIEKYIKSDEDLKEAVDRSSNPLRTVYNLIKKSAAYQNDKVQKAPKPISQEQRRVDEKESKPKTSSMGVRSEAVQTAAAISNSKMTRQQREALWAENTSGIPSIVLVLTYRLSMSGPTTTNILPPAVQQQLSMKLLARPMPDLIHTTMG